MNPCKEYILGGSNNLFLHDIQYEKCSSYFPNNIFSFTDLLYQRKCLTHYHKNLKISPDTIYEIGKRFHLKCNSFTEKVQNNLNLLKQSDTVRVLFPHQANLFPSLNLFAPFIAAEIIKKTISKKYNLNCSILYLIIDYDIANDKRFKTARFPAPFKKNGELLLSFPMDKISKNSLMLSIPKPIEDIVDKWIKAISNTIDEQMRELRKNVNFSNKSSNDFFQKIGRNITKIKKLIWESYDLADSFVEFNAFFISKLINNLWNLSATFLYGSEIHRINKDAVYWGIENSTIIGGNANLATQKMQKFGLKTNFKYDVKSDSLFWYYCQKCHRREKIKKYKNKIFTKHVCDNYNIQKQNSSKNKHKFSTAKNFIFPNVIVDNLFDKLALCIDGSVGYIGQAEHVLISNLISEKMDINIFPKLIFEMRFKCVSITELLSKIICKESSKYEKIKKSLNLAYYGKASIIYYLIGLGIEQLAMCIENDIVKSKNLHHPRLALNLNNKIPIEVSPKKLSSKLNKIYNEEVFECVR